MRRSGNTMLVTGGGSGIGRELARRLHDAGNAVVVAGRRRDALDETASGRANMHAMELDIDSAQGVADFARRLLDAHPALNVVVNNAGIMRFEDVGRSRDLADAEATISTNLLGPIRMIDALVEHLGEQDGAAIVNVTSGLAFVPLLTTPTYNATKAAIHSYTVALREVLKGRVEVIELAPPGVQTDLTPGQSTRPGYLPLDAFIDETMALLAREPTPPEVLVERVRFLRDAEKEDRFDATVKQMNEMAAKARAGS